MSQFHELGLAKPLLAALAEQGYVSPTPIQRQAIPSILAGRDLLGLAQTGAGKTAAFALPILHRLAADPRPAPRGGCRVLVLPPTRELASQIAESFRTYGRHLRLSTAVVFGGVKYSPQARALAAGVDVLVATPGRLIDHLQQGTCRLASVEILVLDEADHMLDLGFLPAIRRILKVLPRPRQSLFFSATMPGEIAALADDLLSNPVRVAVDPPATPVAKVTQRLLFIETGRKRPLLAQLLEDPAMSRALVFARTKRGADRLAKYLGDQGVAADSIHGDKSQAQRERALAAFKGGAVRALVATDIAARGIDVEAVSHVVNFELPNVPEAYVHRIGRTARAGAAGVAISFCSDEERPLLRDIEKLTRQAIATFDRRGDRSLGAIAAVEAKTAWAEPPPRRPAQPASSSAAKNRRRRGRSGGGAPVRTDSRRLSRHTAW